MIHALALRLVGAVALTALAACGFTPLYAERGVATSPDVTDAMKTVTIRPLPDRQGMKLRQLLREQMQPEGVSTTPTYDLEIMLSTHTEELGIRRDATSSRANLIVSATFFLNESGGRAYTDSVHATASYNILDEQYATVASQADAENRAIRRIAEEIKMRLAVYFHQRLNKSVAAAKR